MTAAITAGVYPMLYAFLIKPGRLIGQLIGVRLTDALPPVPMDWPSVDWPANVIN